MRLSKVKLGRRKEGFDIETHLKSNSIFDAETGCLIWTGGTNPEGYGITFYQGRNWRVNRLAACLYGILDWDSKLLACHSCDNPPCFARDHLFAGTDWDNLQDARRKQRTTNQRKTHCPKGHPYAGDNLRIVAASGWRQCRACNRVKCTKKYLERRAKKVELKRQKENLASCPE